MIRGRGMWEKQKIFWDKLETVLLNFEHICEYRPNFITTDVYFLWEIRCTVGLWLTGWLADM